MANPYDFTSGYLSAKKLKDEKAYRDAYMQQQKDELEAKKPYWAAEGRQADARAGLYGEQASDYRFNRRLKLGRAQAMKRSGLLDPDFNLDDVGDSNPFGFDLSGMKAMDSSPVNYDLAPQPRPQDSGNLGYGIRLPQVRGYVDGSRGGVKEIQEDWSNTNGSPEVQTFAVPNQPNIQITPIEPMAAPARSRGITVPGQDAPAAAAPAPRDLPATAADAAPAVANDGTSGAGNKGAFTALKDANPDAAKDLYKDVWKKTSNFKNLSNMLMELQGFDFIEGKVTTKGMLEQVQALKKMQQEGVFSAINEAIYGDPKKALSIYREFGDDKADNVTSMTTFDIVEDVPNNKKTKDKRKGVLITYDDGSTMKVDPRKMIMDAVTIKEFLDYETKVKKELREGEDKDLDREAQERSRQESVNVRRNTNLDREITATRARLSREFEGASKREYETWLATNDPNNIASEETKRQEQLRIENQTRFSRSIADANVALGNLNISYPVAAQAASASLNEGFWKDPSNFARDPKGGYVTKPMYGRTYYQTSQGVWVPSK